MRKTFIAPNTVDREAHISGQWLDVTEIAKAEITSEDPNFPIEFALSPNKGPGWRAAVAGTQVIRIVFDEPRLLRRIMLVFSETEIERTHEFALRCSIGPDGPIREIIRQQWNFSPRGSTREIENYAVDLGPVQALELFINPDLTSPCSFASLDMLKIA